MEYHMKMCLTWIIAAGLVLAVAQAQAAESYPSRPVRIIVSYPPGGVTDIVARIVATRLNEAWGQPVIIDNRAGAGGNVGAEYAARATPDGYTLFVNTTSHAVSASFYPKLSFNLQKDFVGITLLAITASALMVNSSLPVKDVKELIAYAKANPDKLNYGSPGVGTNAHLAMELFKSMTGTRMLHVPYKGNTGVLTDLASGQIAVTIDSLPPYVAFFKTGKIRPLAVSTLQRTRAFPELPTISESGVPGFEKVGWFGFSAPANAPRPVLRKISEDTVRILRLPEIQSRLEELGAEARGSTPEQFDQTVKSEMEKVTRIIREAKIEPQ
ncbi:MAG TPA: tripartite tricarboxylate transporter substrate binding protein [Burkholderiales bacterium]|nr:tripartite tricarboxylate transporter substrate binding protein [Burkholderiales bacterium]